VGVSGSRMKQSVLLRALIFDFMAKTITSPSCASKVVSAGLFWDPAKPFQLTARVWRPGPTVV
jgi:hypothetical protein